MRFLLDIYAGLMVRGIEAVRRFFPAGEGEALKPNFLYRDYEFDSVAFCQNCGHRTRHHMIEWLPERVIVATCKVCSFEATL